MSARMRILNGEFEGELLYKGMAYSFAAIKNDLGLSASFNTDHLVSSPSDFELFKALEEVVYGQQSGD